MVRASRRKHVFVITYIGFLAWRQQNALLSGYRNKTLHAIFKISYFFHGFFFVIFNAAQPGVGRVQILGSSKKKKTFLNGLGHKALD